MRTLHKFFFFFAGLFAIAVSVYIAVTPLTITSVTARNNVGGALVEETTHQVSWYSVQGWWGIFILALFAALYAGNAYFGVTKRWKLLAVGTPIVLILTYLAGFSIGAYYLPAAILTILGGIVFLIDRGRQFFSQVD